MRNLRMLRRLGPVCVLAAMPAVASAAPFTNGSFESIGLGLDPGSGHILLSVTDPLQVDVITGWILTAGSVDYIGGTWQASEGSRSLDMNGVEPGAISQEFDTVPGQHYEVRFDLAGNSGGPPTVKLLRVSAGPAQGDYAFDATLTTPASMGWVEQLFSFTAAGPTTTLRFESLTTSDRPFYGPALDNVRVTPVAVPEPAAFALMATAMAAFASRRRRR